MTKYIYNINNNIKSIYSNSILDSSLITATKSLKIYNTKVVQCGDIIQFYLYSVNKKKNNSTDILDMKKIKINKLLNNINYCDTSIRNINIISLKIKPIILPIPISFINLRFIDLKNINRSKINCQLLAKSNISSWRTFITLTYSNNFTDVKLSRKHLKNFIDSVRRIKKDFKYLCITEFQKRGAIHYHLLTNIEINDNKLMYLQEDNKKFTHIKYWNYGYNSVELIKGDYKKIIGYISKYMTKDIDNRLFNSRRYLYSQNLIKPKISYLNIENNQELLKFNNTLNEFTIKNYTNKFIDKSNNLPVIFYEFQI